MCVPRAPALRNTPSYRQGAASPPRRRRIRRRLARVAASNEDAGVCAPHPALVNPD
ncbi:conserved hypothetical protein [Curtobacterium sp. 8I-2]|nr:conserved hypothetical protein [Curtobacterium sp. 8I-2]